MKYITYLTILLLIGAADTAAQWTASPGPSGATLRGLASYQNSFVAVTSGGVFRGEGNTWTRISDETSISDLRSTGTVLFGIRDRTLVRSRDGGVTWNPVDQPFADNPHGLIVTPYGLYATIEGKLMRSLDGGDNWETAAEVDGFFGVTAVSDDAVLGMESHFGFPPYTFLRSTDHGSTWENIDGLLPNNGIRAANFLEHDGVIYGKFDDDLFRSDDGGATWREIPGFADAVGVAAIDAIAADDAGVLTAVVVPENMDGFQRIYRFDGARWRQIASSKARPTATIATSDRVLVTAAGRISAIPLDGGPMQLVDEGLHASTNVVFAEHDHRLFVTAPDGVWMTEGPLEGWQRRGEFHVASLSAGQKYLFAFGDGIRRSSDGGNTWENIGQNIIDPLIGEPIYYPTDVAYGGGALWATEGFVSAGEHGDGAGWLTGGVFRSDDDGTTWRSVSGNLPHNGLTHAPVYDVFAGENAIVVTTAAGVFRSVNGGGSWQSVQLPQKSDPGSVSYLEGTGDTLVHASDAGDVNLSVDAGRTWQFLGRLPDSVMIKTSWSYDGGGISLLGEEILIAAHRLYRHDNSYSYEPRVYRADVSGLVDITAEMPDGITFYSFARFDGMILGGTEGRSVWVKSLQSSVDDATDLEDFWRLDLR